MVIRVNSQLATPMLFRVMQMEDVTLEVSADIEGFVIEREGQDDVTGSDRREFHMAIRELMMEHRQAMREARE